MTGVYIAPFILLISQWIYFNDPGNLYLYLKNPALFESLDYSARAILVLLFWPFLVGFLIYPKLFFSMCGSFIAFPCIKFTNLIPMILISVPLLYYHYKFISYLSFRGISLKRILLLLFFVGSLIFIVRFLYFNSLKLELGNSTEEAVIVGIKKQGNVTYDIEYNFLNNLGISYYLIAGKDFDKDYFLPNFDMFITVLPTTLSFLKTSKILRMRTYIVKEVSVINPIHHEKVRAFFDTKYSQQP